MNDKKKQWKELQEEEKQLMKGFIEARTRCPWCGEALSSYDLPSNSIFLKDGSEIKVEVVCDNCQKTRIAYYKLITVTTPELEDAVQRLVGATGQDGPGHGGLETV